MNGRYDAFISYKSSTSRRCAHRLNRHLLAIARNHRGQRAPKIFYDQFSLPPGRLQEGLLEAIRASRHLVVLIDREVAASEWVDREIEEWLACGGTPERLFLVKADRKVDLSWNDETGAFTHPEFLPAPLRNLFTSEQAYIDYPDWALTRPDGLLARLCAALTGADPRDFLVAETEIQRRRNRRIAAVAGVLALSLVATGFFAVRAVQEEQAAKRNATEARAQADAAEALLTVQMSAPRAIDLTLRAAQNSGSTTIRSAMLAISQEARRLKRALSYPADRARNPLAHAAFSYDGSRFLAWGQGPADSESYLQVWDIATGASEFSGAVKAGSLSEVIRVNARLAVACSAQGPVRVVLGESAAAEFLSGKAEAEPASCTTHVMQTGAVALTVDPAGKGTAYHVDRLGAVSKAEGVTTVSVLPEARSAVAAGPSGIFRLRSGQWNRLSEVPAKIEFGDASGRFFARATQTQWLFSDNDDHLTPYAVPQGAVDVAALFDYSDLTSELMWVDGEGLVGWSGNGTTTRVGNSQGEPVWKPFATRLTPLMSQDAVVVYRNTAAVVRSPRAGMPIGAPLDGWQPGDSPGWAYRTVQHRLGVPQEGFTEPIVGVCHDRNSAIVISDVPDGGSLLIDGLGGYKELTSPGKVGAACDVIDAGTSLKVWPGLNGGPIQIRSTLISDSVIASAAGDQLAIIVPGAPIEIVSTLAEQSLPRPWNVAESDQGHSSAFGQRTVHVALDKVTFASGGKTETVQAPGAQTVLAVRPDGLGAAVKASGDRVLIVDNTGVAEGVAACRNHTIFYAPGSGYHQSLNAAEEQIPVAKAESGELTDCRTGKPLGTKELPLQYEVGHDRAVIVTQTGEQTKVTTWQRARASSLTQFEGPPLAGPASRIAVNETADTALVSSGQHVALYRRVQDRWAPSLNIAPNLRDIAGAVLADNGTIIVVASSSGGFELYDAATGRLLISDPNLAADAKGAKVLGISATTQRDVLYIYFSLENFWSASRVVDVPIGVNALATQLCGLYQAPACAKQG